LTPAAARLFRLPGLHSGPDFTAAAAASLAGPPAGTVPPVLAELVKASLLVEHVPGRYVFHDLLRAYATDLAHRIDTDQQRRSATPPRAVDAGGGWTDSISSSTTASGSV